MVVANIFKRNMNDNKNIVIPPTISIDCFYVDESITKISVLSKIVIFLLSR